MGFEVVASRRMEESEGEKNEVSSTPKTVVLGQRSVLIFVRIGEN